MDVLTIATPITPSQGALAIDTKLHIVSMSIAAYEYVANCISLLLIVTHIWPAISSPSLRNIGYTRPLIETSKEIDAT